jgi:hypothetical protein
MSRLLPMKETHLKMNLKVSQDQVKIFVLGIVDVNILDRFGSHQYNSSEWVSSFKARILLYFLYLQ